MARGAGELYGVCALFDTTLLAETPPTEACQACVIAGACLERSKQIVEGGFWDHPLLDPDTAACGGVMLPIGPWAKGKLVDNDMS
jgi:hypothetical protein